MRCPHCKNKVLQKSGSRTRLRTQGPITFDEQGACHAQCYWCKRDLMLPVLLQDDLQVPEEKFVIPNAS